MRIASVIGRQFSVNELEQVINRLCKSELIPTYKAAHEETMSMTEAIVKVENEIDARVKSLYGVD